MSTQVIQVQPKTTPAPVSQEQADAWLGLAKTKNELVHSLGNAELQAQSILIAVEGSSDHAAIDAALAEYRKLHTSIMETRKPYTGAIEAGIIQPLMAFEKRVDPKTNEAYIALSNTSLALRKAEADKAALANAKNQEVAAFKAHVQNEFSRVVSEYKNNVRREIASQYAGALRSKIKVTPEELRAVLATIPVPQITKFNARHLNSEELMAIYSEVNKPDYSIYFHDLMEECTETFANYDSDLANAEAAIQEQQRQADLAALEEQKKLAEEQAITTLIATSETVVVETPRIKRTVQVIVVESEGWAKAVMAGFITNLPHLVKYIRVKSWAKLTIGQMAEYLGKLASDEGVTVASLQYNEVEK